MSHPAASTLRRDLFSAYLASAAKVASWAIISALVYRSGGPAALGIFAAIRATIGVLNYTTLGLGPAMIHALAHLPRTKDGNEESDTSQPSRILSYSPSPSAARPISIHTIYANGLIVAIFTGTVAAAVVWAFIELFPSPSTVVVHGISYPVRGVIIAMSIGTILRLCSDPSGAMLQTRGSIWIDNLILMAGEILWVGFTWIGFVNNSHSIDILNHVSTGFVYSSFVLFLLRLFVAGSGILFDAIRRENVRTSVMLNLLRYGTVLTIAQLADFLYAPTDFLLISWLLNPAVAGDYTPAVQIDAGLLLLVTGLASVLLPKAAIAHARGDRSLLRKYYLRGTVASLITLLVSGYAVWLASPWVFKFWFRDAMPATQAILPLVLVHTIVGGSSAVGRSILLAMGKVKPFTVSVLIAGVTNVILSFVFVKYFDLGLKGIVLGTIVAVVGRCALWMPWYVMRTLAKSSIVEDRLDAEMPMGPA